MLFSKLLTANTFNPFTIQTADTIGTDFSPYSAGTPTDWVSALGVSPDITVNIDVGGQYGKKLTYSGGATDSVRAAVWSSSRLSALDDQEILLLVKPISGTGISGIVTPFASAGIKISTAISAFQSAGIGVSNTGVLSQIRLNRVASNQSVGSSAYTWANNSLYWIRLRNHTVNVNSRKIWQFGTTEPASFTSISVASNTWTTSAGYAGVLNTNFSQFEVHWISVGYSFVAAPFPL